MWGGLIGHGAGRHADLACQPGFAAQLTGSKFWRVHRFSGLHSPRVGSNSEGDTIYEGLVSAGDVLIFNTWLPHETMNWASNSLSLNGALLHAPRTDDRNPFDLDLPLRCFRDDDDDEEGDDDDGEEDTAGLYSASTTTQNLAAGARDEL